MQCGADLTGEHVVHRRRREERVRRAAGRGRIEDRALRGPRAVRDRGRQEPDRQEHAGDDPRSHSGCCRRPSGAAPGVANCDLRPEHRDARSAGLPGDRRRRPRPRDRDRGSGRGRRRARPPRGGRRSSSSSYTSGLAGRQVELDDLLRRHPVEVLHERAQRVAVRGDEHGRARRGGRARSRPPTTAASVRARPSGTRRGGARHGGGRRTARRSRSRDRRSRAGRAARRRSGARSSPAPARTSPRSRPCSCPGARRSDAR